MEIKIEIDESYCLETPNVHDSMVTGFCFYNMDKFSIFFRKNEKNIEIRILNIFHYGIHDFHDNSGITEIFIGSIDDLSGIYSENEKTPWQLANSMDLNKEYLLNRKSKIPKNSSIFFLVGDDGGHISVVGGSVSAWELQ